MVDSSAVGNLIANHSAQLTTSQQQTVSYYKYVKLLTSEVMSDIHVCGYVGCSFERWTGEGHWDGLLKACTLSRPTTSMWSVMNTFNQ